MTAPIGFVLMTHNKPHQTLRLVERLNAMFGHPPIVCHHDFSRCGLDETYFPGNVSFVHPHLRTGWSEFSLVEATARALEQLYRVAGGPDWFVLLSGADYPLKPAERILHDLNTGGYDAHIRYELVAPGTPQREWLEACQVRYFNTRVFSFPFLNRRLRPTRRTVLFTNPLLTRPLLPFSDDFRCYAGSQWFSANRRAAEAVVTFHRRGHRLTRHYRGLYFADESYFQTILANTPGLRLHDENWRYAVFPEGHSSPRTLTLDDRDQLLALPAHFARKFDVDQDSKILDELDAVTV